MNKTELRSHLKQLRQNMADTKRQTLSQQICRRLATMDYSGVHNLHCFETITELNEVDITGFISDIQERYPKIQLYTSRRINNAWKIVSWQDHNEVQAPHFDAVIVPMLGFDTSLHRIGYGGGYYDRFLAAQPQARKIGVCFESDKLEHIPAEPHDVSLDTIITESQSYFN